MRGLISKRIFWIVLYGAVEAVLYAALVPLWEGFDEPYHYGYVQVISQQRRLPVVGKTKVPGEIWQSVALVPASVVVRRNIPAVMTFDEYFRLGRAERVEMRRRLDGLTATAVEGPPNYEAHQAPLAYLALAPVDWALKSWPISGRVLALRIVAGLAACLLTATAVRKLAFHLGLGPLYKDALLFLIFSSQMYYASVAHIANDWLAISLAAWWFAAMAAFSARPDGKKAWAVVLLLALGLLTKAYFVVLVPVAAAALVWAAWREKRPAFAVALAGLAAAAPWYARNARLYGTWIVTQESVEGIGPRQTLEAALRVPWLRAAGVVSHYALWTGNNSFSSFSRLTIDAMLAAMGVAALLYVVRRPPPAERAVLAACVVFIGALAYAVASNYASKRAIAANPWYVQPIMAPLTALLLCGMARGGSAGRWLCGAMVALWTWVAAATYFAKLIPLYGGFSQGRAVMSEVAKWYWHDHERMCDVLSTAAPAPAGVILLLAGVVTGGAIWLGGSILADLTASRVHVTMMSCQVPGSVQRAAANPARSGKKQR